MRRRVAATARPAPWRTVLAAFCRFIDLDTSGEGSLDADELRVGLLKHVGVTISEKEAEEMIRTADVGGAASSFERGVALHRYENNRGWAFS